MRVEMDKLIASLDLPELNKEFMRARWLELVIWMDGKAKESVWWYRRLRLATIIGGVIVPALVSWTVGDGADLIKNSHVHRQPRRGVERRCRGVLSLWRTMAALSPDDGITQKRRVAFPAVERSLRQPNPYPGLSRLRDSSRGT